MKKKAVFISSDNKTGIMITNALQPIEVAVVQYSSARDFVIKTGYETDSYDVIIFDTDSVQDNLMSVTRAFRDFPITSKAFFIGLSAQPDSIVTKMRLKAAGFDVILKNPPDIESLIRETSKLLGIPVKEDTTQQTQKAADTNRAAHPNRALIADPSDSLRVRLSSVLKKMGYDVLHAANGMAALGVIHHDEPSFMVLDSNLATIDGLELIRKVRSDRKFDSSIILLMSSKSDKDVIMKALSMGSDGFISKPFDDIVFARKVEETVKKRNVQ